LLEDEEYPNELEEDELDELEVLDLLDEEL
jgi:hypothetical protein